MFRFLAVALLPLALFLVACGGGANNAAREAPDADPPASVSDDSSDSGLSVADDGTYQRGDGTDDAVVADDSASDDGAVSDHDDTFVADETGSGVDLLGAVNPLQFLDGMDGAALASQDIDPSLEGALLRSSDLPGFQSFGDFSFAAPTDYGTMEMIARMFIEGDLLSDEFDTMVMSAGMILPPEILEMAGYSDFGSLSAADLAELENFSSEFGADFIEVELLDADGLGDSGIGLRMEIDFAALFAGFGPVEGDDTLPDGIAMEAYMFFAGDRLLMAMVAWPTNVSPSVDARELAGMMDSRS